MSQTTTSGPSMNEMNNPAPAQRRGNLGGWALVGGLVVVAVVVVFVARHRQDGQEMPPVTVAVVKAGRENIVQDMWLTAEFRPFQQVSLHAKVAGYLKEISVDVGDVVKAGQKIAELEVPELSDELTKAQFAYQASLQDVKRAQADFEQADVVYQRLTGVAKDNPKLVAQQELDNAKAKRDAANGALGAAKQHVEEAQSEVNKTKTLLDYTIITVPFGGIITKRYVDPGALIQAGISSNSQAMPLVDLAEQDLLRLVFPVPESAAPLVQTGETVEIRVSALNQTFQGKISRFSGKVDADTRTMHTEVDVKDPERHYKPGMYAFVRLTLHEAKNALVVPVQSLQTGEKTTVFILNSQGVIEQRPVTVGLETPDLTQITDGLAEGELVIVGSRSGARPGQKVTGKITELPKASETTVPPS